MPQLIIEVIGDASNLNRTFRQVERQTATFSQRMKTRGQSVAAGFGFNLPTAVGASAVLLGKQFVDASRNAQVILGQTSVAVEDAGLSWNKYAKDIEAASQRISKASAFDDEAVMQSFQVFVRGQKDVAKSLQLTELAADVARGRYTDLESATQLVNKAALGQIGALRRAGIQIDKNATSAQALDALYRAYGDSARTYADSAAGSADKLRVAWENLAEQAGGPLSEALAGVADQLTLIVEMGQKAGQIKLPQLPGGGGGTLSNLLGGLAKKGAQIASPGFLIASIYDRYFGGGGGGTAAGGAGSAGGLMSMLDASRQRGAAGNLKSLFGSTVAALGLGHPGATTEQRNQWFDQMIGRDLFRAGLLTDLRTQIARYDEIKGLIQQRLAITKDVTRRLNLEDQLLQVAALQTSARTSLADLIKQRSEEAAQAAKEAAQAAAEARRRAVELQRGWLDFAIERADATKPLKDDRRAYRALERWLLGRIRQEGRTLELVRDLWRTRQAIRDLNKKNADVDPLAGLMQVSSRRMAQILAAGTGLGAAGIGRLSANIAGAELRPIYVSVQMDGREVGHAVTRQQTRAGYRTARQTSGFRG